MRRVVVTGIGTVSPCGSTIASTWDGVVSGRSGIARIERFDPTDYASQIAGECTDFNPDAFIEKKKRKEMARFVELAIGASTEAIQSSGFEPNDEAKERVGTFIGVGFCGMEAVEEQHRRLLEKGPRRVSAYFIPSAISNMAPGQVSMKFGYKGPSITTTSACSSGAHAIGEAFRWIQRGGIDAAIAGGAEASVTPLGVAGFASMRALSKRNDAPTEASRPFDQDRDGFVIAEGAAVMVLEERDAAIARGANILGEIVGYGATADAYHLTQPAPDHEGAQRAMRLALEDGKMAVEDIGYINAHGTSTPVGDVEELKAIRAVFGAHAQENLWVSSTKSCTGHLLGAAGGLEAAFAVKALHTGVVPPTINLENPSPEAEGLDLVAKTAREKPLEATLTNSFGFGGTNVALVFKKHG